MPKANDEALIKTVSEIYASMEAVNNQECSEKTAAELNRQEIKTVTGKLWTGNNVQQLAHRKHFQRDFSARHWKGPRRRHKKDKLREKILILYETAPASSHPKCCKFVRDRLNEEGIKNFEGKPWNEADVERIVKEFGVIRDASTQAKEAPSEPTTGTLVQPGNEQQATEEQPVPPLDEEIKTLTPTSAVNREAAIAWLTEQLASGRLEKVIAWAERMIAETEGIQKSLLSRPKFKRDKPFSTGIVISDTVLEAARAKQAGEKYRVGASLSALIEYLLWQYAGAPEDLIEGGAGGRD